MGSFSVQAALARLRKFRSLTCRQGWSVVVVHVASYPSVDICRDNQVQVLEREGSVGSLRRHKREES